MRAVGQLVLMLDTSQGGLYVYFQTERLIWGPQSRLEFRFLQTTLTELSHYPHVHVQ